MTRKLLLTLGALAALVLYWHIGLLAILLYVWAAAMTSTANTAKARATEQRVAALVTAVGTTNGNVTTNATNITTQTGRVNNLSGQQTTTNGLSNSNVSGTTDLCNGSGGGTGTTSSAGSPAHTHQYQHSHTAGSLGLVPGGGLHVHNLPTV